MTKQDEIKKLLEKAERNIKTASDELNKGNCKKMNLNFNKVKSIFKEYPYIASAYLFGSSATGKNSKIIYDYCDFEPTLRFMDNYYFAGYKRRLQSV